MGHARKTFLAAIGKQIQELRKARGMSQEELAERCGLHRNTIGHIERGEIDAKSGTVAEVFSALDVIDYDSEEDKQKAATSLFSTLRNVSRVKEIFEETDEERCVLEKAHAPIMKFDMQGTIHFVNESFCALFGFKRKELIGRTLLQTIVPKGEVETILGVKEHARAWLENMLAAVEHLPYWENECVTKNEVRLWMGWGQTAIRANNGDVVGVLVIGTDLTEKKGMERALAREVERSRVITENASDAIWTVETKTFTFTSLSMSIESIANVPQGALLGEHISMLFSPEMENALHTYKEQVVALQEQVHPLRHSQRRHEWDYHAPGGTHHTFECVFSPLFDEEGTLIEVLGVCRDVTERRCALAALQEREERYRTLVEEGPVIMYIASLNGKRDVLYISPQVKRLFGLSQKEYEERYGLWCDRIHPDDKERVRRAVENSQKTGKVFHEEYRVIAQGNTIRRFSDEGVIVVDHKTGERYLRGALVDITQRVEQEANALFRDDKSLALLESLSDVFLVRDLVTNTLTYVSKGYETVWGRSCESLYDNPLSFLFSVHSDDADRVRVGYRGVAEGIPFTSEFRIIRPDGETRHIAMRSRIICDAHGNPVEEVSIAEDITERKVLEGALAESERNLRLATEETLTGLWNLNFLEGVIRLSKTLAHVLCLDEKRLAIPIVSLRRFIHPDDREQVFALFESHVKHEISLFEAIFRIFGGDRRYHRVFVRGKIVERDRDKPTHICGVLMDYSERHAIEAKSEVYRLLVDTSEDLMALVDRNYTYVAANKAYEAVVSEGESVVGKTVKEVWGEDYFKETFRKHYSACFKGEVVHDNAWFEFGEDMRKYMSVSFYPYKNNSRKCVYAVVIYRDITMNKMVEDTLRIDLEVKRRSIEKAQRLQQSLNTSELPTIADVNFFAAYMPSEELGGDFFNIFATRNNKLVIIFADCTGHGIDASMDATLLKSVVDRHVWFLEATTQPAYFLSQVNADMMRYLAEDQFPTLFAGVIDLVTHELTYANANGVLPYVIRMGEPMQVERVEGFHIGFSQTEHFEQKRFTLAPNDVFAIFSDALPEAKYYCKYMSEERHVKEMLAYPGNGVRAHGRYILDEMRCMRENAEACDDFTIALIEWRPPFSCTYAMRCERDFETPHGELERQLRMRSYCEECIQKMQVATFEMVENAFEHGNRGDESKTVRLLFDVDCEKVTIVVTDEGEGFDYRAYSPALDTTLPTFPHVPGGEMPAASGISLVLHCADSVRYNDKGNEVTLTRMRRRLQTEFVSPVDARSSRMRSPTRAL